MHMRVLTVIPLAKNIRTETLSYFSTKDVAPGTLVSVTLRNKIIDAIVTESVDVSKEKGALKEASFSLKKIAKIKGPSFLQPEFLAAAHDTARYFASPIGALLHHIIPQALLVSFTKLEKIGKKSKTEIIDAPKIEKLVFQAPPRERISFYKTYIRESFAQKKSVFICVPTIEAIEYFKQALEKGIETYTITLSSDTPVKKIITEYNKIIENTHPHLIIATPAYLTFPSSNIGTIILEQESAHAYKTLRSPYIDFRVFVESFAHYAKIKLIMSDTLLRVETIWRHGEGELGEVAPLHYRTDTGTKISLVDMQRKKPDGSVAPFRLFSKSTLVSLQNELENNNRSFVFALRKGLSSMTLCRDCGTTMTCDVCGAPLVLYERKTTQGTVRIFSCNKCKKQKDSLTTCPHCKSWHLIPFGIGTDLIESQLKERFPTASIFRIDREVTKTRAQAKRIIEVWQRTPGGILIGTEMAFLFMPDHGVTTSYIISLDSLFTLPSFRMNEKVLHIMLTLSEKTSNTIFLQTQNPDEKVVRSLTSSNVLYCIRDEIAERKLYEYPPFTTFIKISFSGSKESVTEEKKILQELLKDYSPLLYLAYTPSPQKTQKIYTVHATLKVPRLSWSTDALSPDGSIDERLLLILKSLPFPYKIQIDPEDLL